MTCNLLRAHTHYIIESEWCITWREPKFYALGKGGKKETGLSQSTYFKTYPESIFDPKLPHHLHDVRSNLKTKRVGPVQISICVLEQSQISVSTGPQKFLDGHRQNNSPWPKPAAASLIALACFRAAMRTWSAISSSGAKEQKSLATQKVIVLFHYISLKSWNMLKSTIRVRWLLHPFWYFLLHYTHWPKWFEAQLAWMHVTATRLLRSPESLPNRVQATSHNTENSSKSRKKQVRGGFGTYLIQVDEVFPRLVLDKAWGRDFEGGSWPTLALANPILVYHFKYLNSC